MTTTISYLDSLPKPERIVDERPLLRALLFGEPGAGKTTLAGHLVEKKGLIVTADSNYVVLNKYPDVKNKIERQPFKGFRQMREIANAHAEGIKPWSDLDTLIWDPVSIAVQNTLRSMTADDNYRFKNQEMHREIPVRPHYMIARNKLADTVQVLNKSKLNIIYVTHVQQPSAEEKEKDINFAIRSNLPYSCYLVIAAEVQLIGYVNKEAPGKPRLVQLEGTKTISAKSQVPTLPEEEIYTIEDIINGVRLWKSNYTVPTQTEFIVEEN